MQDFLKIGRPNLTLHVATSRAGDQTVFAYELLPLTHTLCSCVLVVQASVLLQVNCTQQSTATTQDIPHLRGPGLSGRPQTVSVYVSALKSSMKLKSRVKR